MMVSYVVSAKKFFLMSKLLWSKLLQLHSRLILFHLALNEDSSFYVFMFPWIHCFVPVWLDFNPIISGPGFEYPRFIVVCYGCVCLRVHVCMCLCVCVCKRETDASNKSI